MENADTPAMPLSKEMNDWFENGYFNLGNGLTKREHYAGLAMQGYIAGTSSWANGGFSVLGAEEAAQEAVAYADALLEELEKQQ